MPSKADAVSSEGMRRFALVVTVALVLWALLIGAGIALF
jgi:hypothetical protein